MFVGNLVSSALTSTQTTQIATAARRQPVASIAALKALTPSAGDAVNTLGYYAAGDGGGGTFYYDAAASAADNGGTIIAPTAGGGRWLRAYSGPVNVRWFGARGNNSTNDAAAVQAAIDVLGPDGGAVNFPNGIYRLNSALTVSVRNLIITGTGNRNVQDGGATPYVDPSDTTNLDVPSTCVIPTGGNFLELVAGSECNGLKVRDLTITGPSIASSAQNCFDFDKAGSSDFNRHFLFERLSIQFFDIAFYFHDTVGGGDKAWGSVQVLRSNIMHNKLIAKTANSVQLNGFRFAENDAGQNGYAPGDGGISISAHQASIENNILEGQRDPVFLTGGYNGVSVANNYFEANTGNALVELRACRGIKLGPNAIMGSHVSLDQTMVLYEVSDAVVADPVFPQMTYLSPEAVLMNVRDGSRTRDILGTSTKPYIMATDPDPRFGELPQDTISAYTAGKLIDGSMRDPSGAQGYIRGTGGTTAALKTASFSSGEFSFSSDQWVVASFILERLVASNDAPYFSFRINDGASDGAWESPLYGLYNNKPSKSIYHLTLATRALTAAAATSLVIYIFPYGVGNAGQSWAWRASPVFAYVVDHPAKIRPYVNQRALISASAAPTVGTWALGDRIYNSAPAGSGTIGWVCTAAGSPGTWKGFGTIEG